ncbi:MAG: GNAT family N-acetyltransferase [Jiangellaceae bacterium]|nr:GNAT family N-acetyltransferase [Jiangellaceae bacterium]
MNELFVAEHARGRGVAEQLIEACRAECVRPGARRLTWQTAPDNHRAQAVDDRIGATRERSTTGWPDSPFQPYSAPVPAGCGTAG